MEATREVDSIFKLAYTWIESQMESTGEVDFIRSSGTSHTKRGLLIVKPVILLLMFYVCLAMPAAAVESKALFKLPWGEEEAALGLIDLPEVERVGPTSFCLNEAGHVFICDGVNRCVKEFDPSGRLVAVVARDVLANHVVVDERGTVFARCDGGRVEVFSGGKRTGGFQVSREVPLIEGYEQGIVLAPDPLRVGGPPWVLVNDPAQRHYQVAQAAVEGTAYREVAAERARVFTGKPLADGVSYQPRWVDRHRGLLRGFSNGPADASSIEITMEDVLGSIVFKGLTPEGNPVVEVERITPDAYAHLDILTYSPSGEQLDSFELPNRYYTTVYRKTWLRPDGAIVQMLTQPDGVSFTVWK